MKNHGIIREKFSEFMLCSSGVVLCKKKYSCQKSHSGHSACVSEEGELIPICPLLSSRLSVESLSLNSLNIHSTFSSNFILDPSLPSWCHPSSFTNIFLNAAPEEFLPT